VQKTLIQSCNLVSAVRHNFQLALMRHAPCAFQLALLLMRHHPCVLLVRSKCKYNYSAADSLLPALLSRHSLHAFG
jgi:hypothetical protein